MDYFTSLDTPDIEDDKQPFYDDFFDAPEPDTTQNKASKKQETVRPSGDKNDDSNEAGDSGEANEDSEGEFPVEDSETDMDVADEKQLLSNHEKKLLKVQPFECSESITCF